MTCQKKVNKNFREPPLSQRPQRTQRRCKSTLTFERISHRVLRDHREEPFLPVETSRPAKSNSLRVLGVLCEKQNYIDFHDDFC